MLVKKQLTRKMRLTIARLPVALSGQYETRFPACMYLYMRTRMFWRPPTRQYDIASPCILLQRWCCARGTAVRLRAELSTVSIEFEGETCAKLSCDKSRYHLKEPKESR